MTAPMKTRPTPTATEQSPIVQLRDGVLDLRSSPTPDEAPLDDPAPSPLVMLDVADTPLGSALPSAWRARAVAAAVGAMTLAPFAAFPFLELGIGARFVLAVLAGALTGWTVAALLFRPRTTTDMTLPPIDSFVMGDASSLPTVVDANGKPISY